MLRTFKARLYGGKDKCLSSKPTTIYAWSLVGSRRASHRGYFLSSRVQFVFNEEEEISYRNRASFAPYECRKIIFPS